jgi:hypothetical protein
MTESIFYIEDLTPPDMELLTQLLSLNPNYPISQNWLHDQSHLISTFPSPLLKLSSLLSRMALNLPFSPGKAKLCNTHKALNAHLIHRIFLEVSAECTTHLQRLNENTHLPAHLESLVKRLHAVNSLWLSPELYRAVFQPMPEDKRFDQAATGCEACILASIGGNHQILSDLRASLLGRRKRSRAHPPILKIVEAWIEWTGRGDDIRAESGVLGKEIGRCRRQMQKARRQMRRNIEDGIADQGEERGTRYGDDSESVTSMDVESVLLANENAGMEAENFGVEEVEDGEKETYRDERHDFEEAIIDYYISRMSTVGSDSHNINRLAEGLQEGYRASIIFDPESGTFHRFATHAKAYTESAYSTDLNPHQRLSTVQHQGRESEKYAQSYQNLVGIQDDDEEQV